MKAKLINPDTGQPYIDGSKPLYTPLEIDFPTTIHGIESALKRAGFFVPERVSFSIKPSSALEDRFKNEIYSGDVIKYRLTKYRVCFGECEMGIDSWNVNPKHYCFYLQDLSADLDSPNECHLVITQNGGGYSIAASECEIIPFETQ